MPSKGAGDRYEVLTDRCVLGDRGAVVSLAPTDATNALVVAGHLRPVDAIETKTHKTPTEAT